jgi:hypothetical protein
MKLDDQYSFVNIKNTKEYNKFFFLHKEFFKTIAF